MSDNKPTVGGQAVIEGVMMRAPGSVATAVREANGHIAVQVKAVESLGIGTPFSGLLSSGGSVPGGIPGAGNALPVLFRPDGGRG